MNWMLGVGVLCIVAGAAILLWELHEVTEFIGRKIPPRWKKWRLIGEHPGTILFYTALIVAIAVSLMVLWRVYS